MGKEKGFLYRDLTRMFETEKTPQKALKLSGDGVEQSDELKIIEIAMQ